MIMKRFVMGLLSVALCLNGLSSSPTPVPSPVPTQHTPVKAAQTEPSGTAPDTKFSSSVTSFSDRLLKKCAAENGEKNLILVKGAVPGPKGGLLIVRDTVKA